MPESFTDRKRLFTGPRIFLSFSSPEKQARISGNNNLRTSCFYSLRVNIPLKARKKRHVRACTIVQGLVRKQRKI